MKWKLLGIIICTIFISACQDNSNPNDNNNTDGQYTNILDFDHTNGSEPCGDLLFDGAYLYGMTWIGGTNDLGTVFKIKPDGSGYVRLLDFAGTTNGSYPGGSLISDGTFLYGMTREGGINNYGTIFKIMPDGSGYVKLLDFAGTTNGRYPYGSLFFDGTFLYGMATLGTNSQGNVFRIMPNGSGFVELISFSGPASPVNPVGNLISDGTYLYGMTQGGGTNGMGTAFKIMPDGSGYVKLLDFVGTANGSYPQGSLIFDGTYLYGMTKNGGANNLGTIFKLLPDGSGYAKLLDFTGSGNGSLPYGSLLSVGGYLYGMTSQGSNGFGDIFKIMSDGSGYVKLLDLGSSYGSGPLGSLITDGTFLYGTQSGGANGYNGCIFKYKL